MAQPLAHQDKESTCQSHNNKQTRLTAVSFYCTNNSQQHTRVIYMEATRTHYTHTRTLRPEVAVNSCSAFSHHGLSFLQDPRAAFKRPGTKLSEPSWSGTDRRVFCSFACFFCWGS